MKNFVCFFQQRRRYCSDTNPRLSIKKISKCHTTCKATASTAFTTRLAGKMAVVPGFWLTTCDASMVHIVKEWPVPTVDNKEYSYHAYMIYIDE